MLETMFFFPCNYFIFVGKQFQFQRINYIYIADGCFSLWWSNVQY